jgi:hypothetical protein
LRGRAQQAIKVAMRKDEHRRLDSLVAVDRVAEVRQVNGRHEVSGPISLGCSEVLANASRYSIR